MYIMIMLSWPSVLRRITLTAAAVVCISAIVASQLSAALPVLHLRKAVSPPPLLPTLQDPAQASAWYPCSPTWFGHGGKTADRSHIEILATYDDSALYIAILNIDRSTVLHPKTAVTNMTTVDSSAIWIQTAEGRRFYLMVALDGYYPPGTKKVSGEFPTFDPTSNKLSGWDSTGWYAGNKTMQHTIRIPWSALGTSAPALGSKWRINFAHYNQTSTAMTPSTVYRQTWAAGTETQPDQWGYLAFDDSVFTPPADVSPEAIFTFRPATGFGEEITLRAGNAADLTNEWSHEAITQSNWNDWDPIDFTIKEYMQFDLSMIPRDRKVISARLKNHYRGHFQTGPTDLYLHVIGLDGSYDPATVTMLTSPPALENGYRRLVQTSEVGGWVELDVTDVVSKAFDAGLPKASFALAGSSGNISNGKIWDVSFGRSDWYDQYRPRLVVTFGKPGVSYSAPLKVGSLNYTSVATTESKNKLTNGTFRYGTVEGITNNTYWLDPGSVYLNNVNVPLVRMAGDINPGTGHPALRHMCPVAWTVIRQIATGFTGGKPYTFSGWYKGSASGIKSDIRIEFQDSNGNKLLSGQAVYSGSGNWEQVKLTANAPSGTVKAKVEIVNWTSGTGAYMLYSDLQIEEGSTPTVYSETMGVYYPDHPRIDGVVLETGGNCLSTNKLSSPGSNVIVTGKAVTGSFNGFFYIQCPEQDHTTCGIKVVSNTAPGAGAVVNVTGTLGADANDELVINADTVTIQSTPGSGSGFIPRKLARSNRQIGGGTQDNLRGPDGGTGINTIGVVQTTWGRVTSLNQNASMIVDDGSKTPVKVVGPTGTAMLNKYVRVDGISSIEKNGSSYIRILRTRTASDVKIFN